jgi:peptidoglycan-N-acetylglucosamine deacetylase
VAAVAILFALSLPTAALVVPSAFASGSSASSQPLQVQAASLVQDGQDLVWRLQVAEPFSPGALAHAQRSLCLLIERVSSGIASGEVCAGGPARGSKEPRLLYTQITSKGSGPARVISAAVTRTSSEDLSASFLPAAVGLSYKPLRWQVISTLRGAACGSPSPSGGSCFELYPGKPTLLKLHPPILAGCLASGPSLVYHGPTHAREVALTFDDGPWNDPPASQFLRVLEREHVPATFFEIGRQIAPFDLGGVAERRMLADGDMIGDHSWSHPDVAALPPQQQVAQLEDAAVAIRHATGGFTPCLWRPPYGDISPSLVKLARGLGFLTIMWSVDPRDWALPGVGAIYSNVVTNSRDGSIVIQHFGGGPRFETLAALPQEIATLRSRGYRIVTVSEMLGLRLLYR